jgi:hypothetical protein
MNIVDVTQGPSSLNNEAMRYRFGFSSAESLQQVELQESGINAHDSLMSGSIQA